MDVRKNRKKLNIKTIIFLLLFLVLVFVYYNYVKNFHYIGICLEQSDESYEVRAIKADGIAKGYDIQIGDIIIEIDDGAIEHNKIVNQ